MTIASANLNAYRGKTTYGEQQVSTQIFKFKLDVTGTLRAKLISDRCSFVSMCC